MTEEAKRDLIRQLKKEVHSNPDLTAMDDGQMRALIQRTLDAKLAWARDNSPEAYRELSSLNFRERHQIAGAVYESIRGLGVLGQIHPLQRGHGLHLIRVIPQLGFWQHAVGK